MDGSILSRDDSLMLFVCIDDFVCVCVCLDEGNLLCDVLECNIDWV